MAEIERLLDFDCFSATKRSIKNNLINKNKLSKKLSDFEKFCFLILYFIEK